MQHKLQAMLEEQERVLTHKQKEREALLKEGFREENEKLKEQIKKLEKDKKEMQKQLRIQTVANVISGAVSLWNVGRGVVPVALRLLRLV
nr:guanylate-binding protein 4-like [Anser cygnoides]